MGVGGWGGVGGGGGEGKNLRKWAGGRGGGMSLRVYRSEKDSVLDYSSCL